MEKLLNALKDIGNKPTPATFIAETVANLKGGKKCPFNGAVKRVRFNAMLNSTYERKVNKQRSAEGDEPDFVPEGNWGEHETPCLIELRGKRYVQVLNPAYYETEYFMHGEPVDRTEVEIWLREKAKSRQGVKNEIKCLRYGLNSIKQVTINGQTIVSGDSE